MRILCLFSDVDFCVSVMSIRRAVIWKSDCFWPCYCMRVVVQVGLNKLHCCLSLFSSSFSRFFRPCVGVSRRRCESIIRVWLV